MTAFKADSSSTRPNIIAGFGNGIAYYDASGNPVSPINVNPGGKGILRFDCGAFSAYASPLATRPYDCDWARKDCYLKTTTTACDSNLKGIVILVSFPQCWDGLNTYVPALPASQDSSSHYAYGSNLDNNKVSASCATAKAPNGNSATIPVPTLSVRYHTMIADACWSPQQPITPTPTNPDLDCAPDPTQFKALSPTGLGIRHDTRSSGIDQFIRFGVAGMDDSTLDIHPYWTAHADFMDSWGQKIFDDLVNACLNQHHATAPCGNLS